MALGRLQRQRRYGLAAELVRPAVQPWLEQVVVMGAAGVAGLAGHVLPARPARVADVGEQAERRRPDARVVATVGHVADCADGLLAAAGGDASRQDAVEQLRGRAVALAERMAEARAVHAAP